MELNARIARNTRSGNIATMALDSDPQIDWRSRTDGKTHTLRLGVHYEREPEKVRRAASMWAQRNGFRALTEIGADSVSIRFTPRTGKV